MIYLYKYRTSEIAIYREQWDIQGKDDLQFIFNHYDVIEWKFEPRRNESYDSTFFTVVYRFNPQNMLKFDRKFRRLNEDDLTKALYK